MNGALDGLTDGFSDSCCFWPTNLPTVAVVWGFFGVLTGDLAGVTAAAVPLPKATMAFLNKSKFRDPRPVVGSHPGVAWNP